jgi:hypothetical protein
MERCAGPDQGGDHRWVGVWERQPTRSNDLGEVPVPPPDFNNGNRGEMRISPPEPLMGIGYGTYDTPNTPKMDTLIV